MTKTTSFLTAMACLCQVYAYAQDLAHRIPEDAFAVVSVRTGHFFNLVDVADFSTSMLGTKMLQAFGKEAGISLTSIEDMGVDIHSSLYYYTRQTDSIWYHTILLPLKNSSQFAKGFGGGALTEADGIYRAEVDTASLGATVRWNDRLAVITFGSVVDDFFYDEGVAARYGILQDNYGDTYAYADTFDNDGYTEEYADEYVLPPYEGLDTTEVVIDTAGWDVDTLDNGFGWDDSTWDTAATDGYDDGYWSQYETNRRKKDSLVAVWVGAYAEQVLSDLPRQHILNNASYVQSLDKDALVTAWVRNLGLIYDQFFLSLLAGRYPSTSAIGFGSLQAGVYANEDELTLKTSLDVQGDLAHSYARIYDHKINRKFLRYLDSDSLMGFFAYAIDMEAYMEEFPKMIGKIYGPMVGGYEEEIHIGTDILALLLDEKAIGETVKGDALFVLNGLTQHEIAYTDYEYDEDYNVTEVEKTKTETIPDFLLMFSSDNHALYQRLMDYTVNKGVGTLDNRVYALSHRKLPAPLYVTYRNGIVFLGTAHNQLERIASNRTASKASRFHRKLLRQNIMTGFLNTQQALGRFSDEELSALEEHIRFKQLFGHLGNFYFRSGKMKGNTFSGEFVAQAPKDFSNALQYLLWLVDYASNDRR